MNAGSAGKITYITTVIEGIIKSVEVSKYMKVIIKTLNPI